MRQTWKCFINRIKNKQPWPSIFFCFSSQPWKRFVNTIKHKQPCRSIFFAFLAFSQLQSSMDCFLSYQPSASHSTTLPPSSSLSHDLLQLILSCLGAQRSLTLSLYVSQCRSDRSAADWFILMLLSLSCTTAQIFLYACMSSTLANSYHIPVTAERMIFKFFSLKS